ncbi:MAG: cytidine deaminase [Paracoccaceae bacterium]
MASIDKELLAEALQVRELAHAPYSRFQVGAAIRAASGRIYRGCNVENVAYPQTLCAEAGAIAAMVAGGDREITAVAVIGDCAEPLTPCGGCRQKLAEFAAPSVPVSMANTDGKETVATLGELLPGAFGPAFLDRS